MIPSKCVELQTSPVERPSVPPWFAEIAILSQHLATKGLLEAFADQIRLVRGHFGHYEPIDFLVLLIGYAVSGERTLADFFERLSPFGAAFMALFGRAILPHRATLSRFLADVNGPCLEAFRTLFEQFSFPEGWTKDSIGGIFDRQGRRYIVFDVDATRQAAAPSCFTLRSSTSSRPCVASIRSVHRVTRGASGVRWCAHEPRRGPLHTRQWISTCCRARQWRLSEGTGLGPACHRDLLEALRSRHGSGTRRVSMGNMATQ